MQIYKITNTENGKIYIGQTTRNFQERWDWHKRNAGKGHYLHNALAKYGVDKFTCEVIEEAGSIEELNIREVYWIDYYKSTQERYGYNLRSGGAENSRHSDETKKKLSLKLMGNKNGVGKYLPIKELKNRLKKIHGDKIKIDEKTYKGYDSKCFFLDKQYGRYEAYPQNVLKGAGNKSRAKQLKRNRDFSSSIDKIKSKLDVLYQGKIKLKEDSYRGMLTKCAFTLNENEFFTYPTNILRGILPREVKNKL